MATIRKKGDFQFHVQIRRKHYSETKTFTTKKDAEAWARQIESEIDRGVFISKAEGESTTFGDACDRYEREVLPKLKGASPDRSRIKFLKTKIGKLPLASISSSTLASLRDSRLKEVSPQTVIHELGLIQRVLKMCVIDWGIALPAGVPQVRKPTKPEGRNRRISDEEIEAICTAAIESIELPLIIRVALQTAMRRSEISKLKYEDIDFSVPCFLLKDTKNGSSRQVPMSVAAVTIVKSMPRRIDGKLFTIRPDSITQAFERAVARARKSYEVDCEVRGIEVSKSYLLDIRFHDLRHEATTRIADKVDNLIELATITGHKDLQMLKRYYHPKTADLAKKLG